MAALLAVEATVLAAPSPDSLAREVRALLSDRCFACHGPDSNKREADLRLDIGHDFIVTPDSDNFGVVVAGTPDESELLRRIESDDSSEQMPPPESKLTLSTKEKELVRRWIAAGAPWQQHWAFVPPAGVEPPVTAFDGWKHHPIDRFVALRLEQEGLEPAPKADRATLLRRVTLDLTGLPPTIAEINDFLADESPDAYEKVVDRLLASPRFGERMAVDWLDAARYADTYGYQNDRFRRVWPWRDWVVQALNDNLPYDQFLTWQLAGDLLSAPTREQRLATTFCRLHRETNEGGSLPKEFRTENVADRTNTLGAAVLGLTLECARCHDHKFDPVSQKDYYQLFAYFNNTGELGLYSHFTDAIPTPAMNLPTAEQAEEIERLEAGVQEARQRVDTLRNAAHQAKQARFTLPEITLPEPVGSYGFDSLGDGERWIGHPQLVDGPMGKAIELNGENGWQGPPHSFERSDPFTLSVWVRPTHKDQNCIVVHRSQAWLDAAGRGYQITLDEGRPRFCLVHFWPGDAISVVAEQPLPLDEWTHLVVTYDGSSTAAGVQMHSNGLACQAKVSHDSLTRTIRYVKGDLASDGNVRLAVGHRFRDTGFRGGSIDHLQVFDTQLTALEVRKLSGRTLEDATPTEFAEYALVRSDQAFAEAIEQLGEARRRRDAARDAVTQIAVMQDQPEREVTHLLRRGAYDAPGEVVEPRPLSMIGTEISAGSPNRLGLAQWLTDPEHPLTSRVAVNRFWQSIFGRGLVSTPNDFGSQGSSPTHPELLDYLAVRFVETGWDVKALIRLMVTSAAYQQSSIASAELLERDPDNELLAHGPSGRLTAEMVRDAALASSGLLVEHLGGAPVHPFQPAGLWKEKGAATYQRDRGAGSHRRSLYTIWKRTSPPPAMMSFDSADREVCVMQRQATVTPLQALVLLNDPQQVEAACALAYRVQGMQLPTVEKRLARLFRIATSRHASEQELLILEQLFEEQRQYYDSHPADAIKLLSVGDLPEPAAATAVDTAAMATVAQAVLNHDAAIMKR
ncbi:DUF1553 domain-containing protein [Aeoliella sp. ICT_H6.2]|uniref:DUF1553 domain-containing protein n=1 Tax=Aeoliella straminimaris TaxID=2954799 RepID=A0A9X2JHP2_9BACT|nr:DUF1553 domain-containing protein [Aeoliella straminimaris]MCO6046255.1 DUF1553 domain-containing protein [Aeoliella straminimaris]